MGGVVEPPAQALPVHLTRHVEDHGVPGFPGGGVLGSSPHESQGTGEDQVLEGNPIRMDAACRMEDRLGGKGGAIRGTLACAVRLDVEGHGGEADIPPVGPDLTRE